MSDSNRDDKSTESRQSQLESRLDDMRFRLAHLDALPQLMLLSLLVGVIAGAVIVLFRWASEYPLLHWTTAAGDFENMPPWLRFTLPIAGALLLGLLFHLFSRATCRVGVVHVLDRLNNQQGYLPSRNLLMQFFAGSIALLSGHSVGREGPSVHLGAASGSWLAQRLKLPNNAVRTLVGSGVAAAIAASFNTPLAGVVFAMEVILLEYRVASFLPVILAAVFGSAAGQLAFGSQPLFAVPPIELASLAELPLVFLSAIVLGAMAALFIRWNRRLVGEQSRPAILRFLVVGIATGAIGLWVPEVLGTGYDTIEQVMLGKLALQALIVIFAAKFIASCLATGLGIPGGVIGPSLVLGACLGGIAGHLAEWVAPAQTAGAGFHAMLGVAGMMAAVLNAPLAALLALLELTYNPKVLFPAMMMIAVSSLVARHFFQTQGIFQEILKAQGRAGTPSWRQQILSRIGVFSAMDRSLVVCARKLSFTEVEAVIAAHPGWIVIPNEDSQLVKLLRAADLANFIAAHPEFAEPEAPPVDLLEIPAERRQLTPVPLRATLMEAQLALEAQAADGVYVERRRARDLERRVAGIILPDQIDSYYKR
ncbi:chloride channel protein [Biformimicrobium ophioploci]|uniref:chloride channel protein n=1 Tax=Biformimicrobium ophioploci TaxID=3036711 RepID=UPI0025570FB0|nr:chloride channel protein [Microbulbifer sp. NKW57]